MPHCMVPFCTNGYRKTKGTKISYHRLPVGPLRNIWLRNIRRENPRSQGHSFVCSEHFSPDCYENEKEVILGFSNKGRKLKRSSVPTIFPFSTKSKEMHCRQSSTKQIQNRGKKVRIY